MYKNTCMLMTVRCHWKQDLFHLKNFHLKFREQGLRSQEGAGSFLSAERDSGLIPNVCKSSIRVVKAKAACV